MIPKRIQSWKPEPGYTFKCGLEIHTQLKTKHKLFSLSPNNPFNPPNSNTCFFDVGLPGTFPKLNPEALLLALKAATVMKSTVNTRSSFDRKHYFYLDQPLGYQITQRYNPLAKGGRLVLTKEFDDVAEDKIINIEQIQLEQDTAKLNYDSYERTTAVDLNRANVPLIELVTKPDFDHFNQVRSFVKKYINLMTHLEICSGDLENGALRCDVNVSVNGGNRVEIKNLGSTSEILAALRYEYSRQVQELKKNPTITVPQETRSWDGEKTLRTRSKEDAVDYRYFPDSELGVVLLEDGICEDIEKSLPQLPEQLAKTLMSAPYHLEKKIAIFLVGEPKLLLYYKDLHALVVRKYSYKAANNWLVHELLGAFNKLDKEVDLSLIPVEKLAQLISMVQENQLTITSAKLLLTAMIESPENGELSIEQLVDHYDLGTPTDMDESEINEAIHEICGEIIANNPDVAAKIKKGKHKSINYLVGVAMKETQGKIQSKLFENAFREILLK